MKLTWFGGHTLRVQIGGEIIVFDPTGGPANTDHAEVVGGADQVFEWAGPYLNVDAKTWRPRRATLLAEPHVGRVEVYITGFGSRLIDAVGEPPLVLMGSLEGAGKWAKDAVVVAFSRADALAALDVLAPRLIALAMPEEDLSGVFPDLSGLLDGTVLVSLEPGLALEV